MSMKELDIIDERALSSEQLFRQVVENIHEVLFLISPDWRTIYYISPAYEKIWGRTCESLLQNPTSWIDSLHPEDHTSVLRYIEKKVSGDLSDITFPEYRIIKPDGSIKWIKACGFPIRNTDGIVYRIAGIATDITHQKLKEQETQLNEERLKLVLEGSQQGFWDWNIETGEVQRNERWAQMLGYSLQEFESNTDTWTNAIHPDDRDAAWASIYNHLEGRTDAHKLQYRMRTKDGSYKWILDQARIVQRAPNGRPLRMSGTHTDISEHVRLENNLRQSQKMEAIGKLTGGIAHDFNNMLSVILGYSELIMARLASNNPPLARYTIEIINAAERARNLTSKLLEFSHKSPSSAGAANINQIVLKMQHMLEKTLTPRVALTLELDNSLWTTLLDTARLEDAVVNMCINAMHAMPNGGTLKLSSSNTHVARHQDAEIEIPVGDYARLSITDTGTGMSQEIKQKMFDPFFTTKGHEATGLGLSQVYGFVHQSDGYIQVDSQPGLGTCISLYFPRFNENSVDHPDDFAESPIEMFSGNETILVVDDEDSVRNLSKEILASHGYSVICAENASQALDILSDISVDVLLSDVIMPGMNGYQLAAVVAEQYPSVKVQIFSGYSDTHKPPATLESLYNRRLAKPFHTDVLLKTIRNLLDGEKKPVQTSNAPATEIN